MNTIATSNARYFTNSVKVIGTAVCLTFLLVACQKPEQKVEDAKDKVTNAKQDLNEATREARTAWQEAYLKFKRDNDTEIAANERRIIDLRKDVSKLDERYRSNYNVRIDELEKRNNDLRDRVSNYKDEGDVKWEEFTKATNRDMDDLTSSLKKITIKNG
jgi:predicted  nucleic acid-binding Zn-ribbon protein